MKFRFFTLAGNFLFALNVFILFLLIFESKLSIPLWLQPFGRMHLLLLHFPIVLLLLAMGLEVFRFSPAVAGQEFYQRFTTILLLIGVLSAGVTVVMGFFLSREGEYGLDILSWHKYSGVTVFFLGSVIYSVRNAGWYRTGVTRIAAAFMLTGLLFTGHFGSVLTHGEYFLWNPVLNSEAASVPLEEAKVFEHVVLPIFEKKCTGCHNRDKLKGKLVLSDSVSVLRGGKTGKLFVAGNMGASLLLRRIHLPAENKKHMPPSGNVQLTPDETEVLTWWVKSFAGFGMKITSLPARDSLRLLATSWLSARDGIDELYDFSAADEKTIRKLNTNYRVIAPLSRESPALAVNIYNKASYNASTLDELSPVRTQIVSLEMNRIPVKDEDLKKLSNFENLRKLNLNYTDLSGSGLAALTPLRHLKSLSLSGTPVSYKFLKEYIPRFQNLGILTLWNTGLTETEIAQLQADCKSVQLVAGFRDDGSHLNKLNPPRVNKKLVIFKDSLLLPLFHPVKGVDIRFTLDGSEPDSVHARLFDGKTVLKASTAIKARAYKTGWLASDVATLNLYRSSVKPDSAMLLSKLNRVHPANGAQTFFDHQLGSFNANSPAWANNWAGFYKNDMELLLEFKKPKLIGSVSLNSLIETETGIFPPSSIEVWSGSSPERLQLVARMVPEQPGTYQKPYIKMADCRFKPQSFSFMKIIAKPGKLPIWHRSKGQPVLLLVDEVFLD